MKHCYLTILFLAISFEAFSQEHQTFRSQCRFYVPTNNPRSAEPDGYAGCVACMEIIKKENEALTKRYQAEERQRQENIAKQTADRLAMIEAQEREIEKRNSAAVSELAAIENQIGDFEKFSKAAAEKRQAINERYRAAQEQKNQAYSDYLTQLQQASSRPIPAPSEAFWKETVVPAGYLAFSAKSGQTPWGFKDSQGNVKLPPQYKAAKDFSGGISVITDVDNQHYIINTKGEKTIHLSSPAFLAKLNQQTDLTLAYVHFPDTIVKGMIYLEFNVAGSRGPAVGVLDREGNLMVPPFFSHIEPFKNGTAKAEKKTEEDTFHFEEFPRNYYAYFTYSEVGLIDEQGQWASSPTQKLTYRTHSSSIAYLTVSSKNDPVQTQAEKEAAEARWELKRKQLHEQSMEKLQEEVNRRVRDAEAQGYLIEEIDND